MLRYNRNMEKDKIKYYFGIDVGGTTTKMGIFRMNGDLVDKWEIETRTENGGEAILPDISESICNKQREHGITREEILAVGIGVPAAVHSDGIVENTSNLGWGYKEVKRELGELTNFPIYVENDANLAALGEMWKGAGRGHRNLVMVTLGTGVGGGIIADGHIITGVKGGAGEIGEICVDQETDGDDVVWRNLEYYASATGIVRLARRKLKETTEKTILHMEKLTAKDVFDAVKAKDRVAVDVAEAFGYYLGRVLSDLAVILAPEVFVIGGGVSKAGDVLLEYIQRGCTTENIRLVLAELGNDAGIYGAARLALRETATDD